MRIVTNVKGKDMRTVMIVMDMEKNNVICVLVKGVMIVICVLEEE